MWDSRCIDSILPTLRVKSSHHPAAYCLTSSCKFHANGNEYILFTWQYPITKAYNEASRCLFFEFFQPLAEHHPLLLQQQHAPHTLPRSSRQSLSSAPYISCLLNHTNKDKKREKIFLQETPLPTSEDTPEPEADVMFPRCMAVISLSESLSRRWNAPRQMRRPSSSPPRVPGGNEPH